MRLGNLYFDFLSWSKPSESLPLEFGLHLHIVSIPSMSCVELSSTQRHLVSYPESCGTPIFLILNKGHTMDAMVKHLMKTLDIPRDRITTTVCAVRRTSLA